MADIGWIALIVVLAIGAARVGRWFAGYCQARQFTRELSRVLAPLTLPLLILALVAAARALPLGLAVVVYLLAMLFAWYLVINPEWTELARHMSPPVRRGMNAALHRVPGRLTLSEAGGYHKTAVGSHVLFLAVALSLAIGLVFLLSPSFFAGRGGYPTAFAEGALILAGVALVARLVGFACTLLRLLLAAALVFLAARAFMRAGFFPGDRRFEWIPLDVLAIAVLLLLVACAAIEVACKSHWASQPGRRQLLKHLDRNVIKGRIRDLARKTGYSMSLVSAGALVVAVFWGIYVIAQKGPEDLTKGRGAPSLDALAQGDALRPSTLDDERLVQTYMPVLVYTEGQGWLPTTIGSYLEDAHLIARDGTTSPAPTDPSQLPDSCGENVAPPCYRLTIECAEASLPCAGKASLDGSGALHHGGTVYARVLRRHGPGSPAVRREADIVFAHRGPFDKLSILAQYWLFYRYDEWTAPTMFGHLVQRHEADWEAITIGFSDDEPLFVAYSAHCGGRWERWADIKVAADATPPTHPLVAVAEGSQANYVDAHERRPPDWASCLDIDGSVFAAISYVWGVEDVTEDYYRLMPAGFRLVQVDEPPMNFPGSWGGHDEALFQNARSFPLAEGNGPLTPSLQQLWLDPLSTIFCSQQWRRRMCGEKSRPPEDREIVAPVDD